jgi:hypothetical protein
VVIHLLSAIVDEFTVPIYLKSDYFFTVIHGQSRLLHQCQLPSRILMVEAQYTEMSINSFMTFWILILILWKHFIDFHVYIVPFNIIIMGIISHLLLTY